MKLRTAPVRTSIALACALTLLAACNRSADTPTGAATPSSNTAPDSTSSTSSTSSTGSDAGRSSASMPSAPGATTGSGMAAAPAADTMPDSSALAAEDAKFVKAAAEGGLYEVTVGKLAADKASKPEVRAFGSMLVEHHSAANDKLKELVSARATTLPTRLPAEMQKKVDQLGKLSGAAFDRRFLDMVGIADHKKDIADFEKASRAAKAEDIRAFASQALPTLQAHLAQAQKLQASVGKDGSAS